MAPWRLVVNCWRRVLTLSIVSVQQLMNNTNSLFCCMFLFFNHSKLGTFFFEVLSLKFYGPLSWYVLTHCSNSTTFGSSLDFDLKEIYGVCQPPFCFTSFLLSSIFSAFTSQLNENKKEPKSAPKKNLGIVKEELLLLK